ncbi:uncharacterized protein [Antennarius striatus]|uniref:uncharacterized protein n=1 Tax=Antennarius striatus TaxID=241820 RepID=UPI0035B4B556
MTILLQGLTLFLLGLSCEATSLGMSVSVVPLEESEGSMVRAHFTVLAPLPCPSLSGLCANAEECFLHVTSTPTSGMIPGWCVRQWYKVVPSQYSQTITLGSNTEIFAFINAGPSIHEITGNFNRPPFVALPPPLRGRENCPQHFTLSVRDLDRDTVQCRFADGDQGECVDCAPHPFIELDGDNCALTFNGNASAGQYFIFLIAEDLSVSPEPLSAVPVQLSLTVEASSTRCSEEPLANDNLEHTSVQRILPFTEATFEVSYMSMTENIQEVVVVGPPEVRISSSQSSAATISWIRTLNMLPRLLSICVTANTESLQSEFRCVWLDQDTPISPPPGTELLCNNTEMTLVLPITSLSSINLTQLQLNDPACPISVNDTHITAEIPFDGCGTETLNTNSELIFTNTLRSALPTTVITRQQLLMFPLACRLPQILATGPPYNVSLPSELEVFGEVEVRIIITLPEPATRLQRQTAMIDMLDVTVTADSLAQDAQLVVSNCIMSETADFAQFVPIVERGCLDTSMAIQVISTTSNSITYRIELSNENEAQSVFFRCSINLCIPLSASATCPNLCNATLNETMLVTTLFTRVFIVTTDRIDLVVPIPEQVVNITIPPINITAHAPERASALAAGMILATISVVLQHFFLN